jgi:hypothetical protein
MNVRAVHVEATPSVLRQQLSLGTRVRNRPTVARVQLGGKEIRAEKMLMSVPATPVQTVVSAPSLWVVLEQIASVVSWGLLRAKTIMVVSRVSLNIIGWILRTRSTTKVVA